MTLQVHDPETTFEVDPRLRQARDILRAEAEALLGVADRLGDSFLTAVDLLFHSTGRVCVTGTGKSADIGQKIAGTLNSTGTRAYVLDSTKAMHGDLGMVATDDIVLALSNSGESEEIIRLIPSLRQLAGGLIGVTSNGTSTLARSVDAALILGPLAEADPLGLAPSTSTTAMIAVGDALAFVLSNMRAFNREDFARFHPAGSLGRKLMKVENVMRRGRDLRLARCSSTVREVFSTSGRSGRRTGAVLLVDDADRLCGIFTDSDLARLFEQRRDAALDRPIAEVMIRAPLTVPLGTRLLDAVDHLSRHKISELPVIDDAGRPAGLIDITDVVALLPGEASSDPNRVRVA
jgi:arabinose-5-phosphate isomerase